MIFPPEIQFAGGGVAFPVSFNITLGSLSVNLYKFFTAGEEFIRVKSCNIL
jgi:hypothetical protein